MARRGRRLVIGGSGNLQDDDPLADGVRGEVKRYTPLSEDEARKQAADVGRKGDNAPAGAATPVIVTPPDDSSRPTGEPGSDQGGPPGGPGAPPDAPPDTGPTSGQAPAPDAPGTGPGEPGDTSGGAGDPSSARGRKVTGSEKEHPVTAQAGEWIIQESAVKKYGDAFMKLLNAGKIPVMKHTDVQKHFAKGGPVTPAKRSGRTRLGY